MRRMELIIRIFLIVAGLCFTLLLRAQQQLDFGISLPAKRQWYEQPFVWVAAACFVLYLMMVLIKRSERDS